MKKNVLLFYVILISSIIVHNRAGATDPLTAWTFKAGSSIYSYPVVADTILYFGSLDQSFYALNTNTGGKLWSFSTPYPVNSMAMVCDGIVCFESGNRLYALDAITGDSLWSFVASNNEPVISLDMTDYHHSSPVEYHGAVYYGDGWGNMNGLDLQTGQLVFQFNSGANSAIRATPAILDSVVYYGDWDSHVYAVSLRDSTLLWTHLLEGIRQYYGAIVSQFVIKDTLLYFGSQHDIYSPLSINTGLPAWTFDDHKQSYLPSVPVFYDDAVIIGTTIISFRIYSVTKGNLNWEFQTSGICFVKPVIQDTILFMNTSNFGAGGNLYMIDARNGGMINEYHILAASPTSPVISGDLLFIGDNNGIMNAIRYKQLIHCDTMSVSMDTTTLELNDFLTTDENYSGEVIVTNTSTACDYFSVQVERTADPGSGLLINNFNGIHIFPDKQFHLKYTIKPSLITEGSYAFTLNINSRRYPEIIQSKTIRFKVIAGTSGLPEQKEDAAECSIYPVPVKDYFCVSLTNQNPGMIYIRILSSDGRLIIRKEFRCSSDAITLILYTEEFSRYPGNAFIYNVISAGHSYSGTFTKE
jgi:eukaryotic-like serine/threonine-protein kinase